MKSVFGAGSCGGGGGGSGGGGSCGVMMEKSSFDEQRIRFAGGRSSLAILINFVCRKI